jgi:hypothetical protein
MIVGRAARVIDRLQEARGARSRWHPGRAQSRQRDPHAHVMRALQLLCQDVMPRFK